MSGERLNLTWVSPGPVSSRFWKSALFTQILNGPIGSGKTTSCLMKAITLASKQKPSTRDRVMGPDKRLHPVRRFSVCVVRDTYRQLWRSTLPSWWERCPRDVGDFKGGEDAPAKHRISFLLPDDTLVDFTADFVAIGENSAEDVLRGYQVTCFYLNEIDLLTREVFTYCQDRTGRFPSMAEGGPSWRGVLADCNAPELNNWVYQDFFTKTPEQLAAMDADLFRMPGGTSPDAENRGNLPPDYYEGPVRRQPAWYVARMIHNRPGYSRAGKPVYPEFVDALHVRRCEAMPGLAVGVGLDAGMCPAAVLGQRMPNGQRRVFAELVAEQGTGATRFGQMLAKLIHEKCPGIRTIRGYADPSAAYGADINAGERTWIEIVAHEAGIRVEAASTNKLVPRLEAVRKPLMRLIDGEPGLLLSENCPVLREGFNASYRYRRIKPDAEQYTEEPEKGPASHPHDALQYWCLADGEDLEIADRRERREKQTRQVPHEHEWDPYAR